MRVSAGLKYNEVRVAMSYSPQRLLGLACAVCLLGSALTARGQDAQPAIAAMREAAEEQADLDPGPARADSPQTRPVPPRTGRAAEGAAGAPVVASSAPKSTAEQLHQAMRSIAREEVARDLALAEAASRGAAAGPRRGSGGRAHPSENEADAREQARGTAVQAQIAKAVGTQRSLEARGNGNAYGLVGGNGNGNGRSALSSPGVSLPQAPGRGR